jgi:energy-converting hydrogenase Eha subunit H
VSAGQPLRDGGGDAGRFTPTLWVMLVVALGLALAAAVPDVIVYRAPEQVGHVLIVSRIPLIGCAVALTLGVVVALAMGGGGS